MKRVLLGACVVGVLAVTALSRSDTNSAAVQPANGEVHIAVEKVNPWSHLKFNNGPGTFRFAIVTDRTGGVRAGVFERAVQQLNWLQPEFVVSVGDLITGGTEDARKFNPQWDEFNGFISKLEMPFFYVPGNHDISNLAMAKRWGELFGRSWYHFVYRDVLFLLLNSEDPPVKGSPARFSKAQTEYVARVLRENAKVRWTLVFFHKPIWTYKDQEIEKSGWLEIEGQLKGRKYTVFAGHKHNYEKAVRGGMNYYMLATTGGGSKLRGTSFGEFDHLVWVTMKDGGPMLANLLMEGIYPEDIRRFPAHIAYPPTKQPEVKTAEKK